MFELSRCVRFSIHPISPGNHRTDASSPEAANGFAGWPRADGFDSWVEVEVRCRGTPDPRTGYLLDIKAIDRAVRATILPAMDRSAGTIPRPEPVRVLRDALAGLDERLGGRLTGVIYRFSPYYSVEMTRSALRTVLVRQRFDFAASHRLHSPSLSDEQNRELFGKCNYPSGHGHNYRVEPCVEVPIAPDGDQAFTLAELERIVDRTIIERFDHRHLNLDTPEFGPRGVNPTVENISKVFFDLLDAAIRGVSAHAKLRSITVWETDRTSCTYPAPN